MTSIALVWHVNPVHYRLKVFAGPSEKTRALTGELTMTPAEAAVLHSLFYAGWAALGICNLKETGWRQPVNVAAG